MIEWRKLAQQMSARQPVKIGLTLILSGLFFSLVLLLNSRAEPAVAIMYATKVDSLAIDADSSGSVTPGDTLLYSIVITNSGDTPAFGSSFGDSPDPETALVVGSVQTSQGTILAGNTPGDLNVYIDIGDIAAFSAVTISFRVQINNPLPAGVVDVANQGLIRYTDGVALFISTDDPDTGIADDPTYTTVIRDPALIVQKTLVGADSDLVWPNYMTFTISIYNVGLAADAITLTDDYDPFYLSFVDASPYPEEDANDGSLMWYDLTGPAPNGFGANLLPGNTFDVTIVFSAANDITTTVNTATVIDAVDTFGDPLTGTSDSATVVNIPTAAEVIWFRVDDVDGKEVHLAWATATEIDNVGFKLFRAYESVQAPAEIVAYIPSQAHGSGATYTHVDTVPHNGIWWYWLVDVDTSGQETFQGALSAAVDKQLERLFLPLVLRTVWDTYP